MTEFFCPTKIWSGAHALESLREFKVRRVLLVTDGYFSKTGKAAEIASMLPEAAVEIFDEVLPDPTAELAAKGAAICQKFKPELLIALGGGSPMDCAKAIRLAWEGKLIFLAIPTTSGSGSEVTSYSVLTHGSKKYPVTDPLLRPDYAILDECLLTELPQALIADTGMDLLTHCVEAVTAKNRSGFSDALAIHGAATVFRYLTASFSGDRSVRGKLHEAAAMAGLAFEHAGLGLCHAAAHVLGGVTHLPHGRLCAMLLPCVMEMQKEQAREQYALLAAACGTEGATKSLSFRNLTASIIRLRTALGMPATLRQAGVADLDPAALIKPIMEDPCCSAPSVCVTEEQVSAVLKAVLG